MSCQVLLTLSVLGASSTLGTEPPPSNQGDVTPSPHYDSRIVRGDVADIEEFPFVAAYHWKSAEGYKGFCSGVIVSDQFVVTAAHCVDQIADPSELKLQVGSSNRTGGIMVEVLQITIHPDYFDEYLDDPKANFDVAVLKTNQIVYSDKVQQIDLPDPNTDVPEYVTVAGWGSRKLGGMEEEHLWSVELETVDYDICKSDYYPILETEMFCAGGYMKGVCKGDDGDPAVQQVSENQTTLEGITLFQRGCGSEIYPAIFIKVSSPPILDFIKNTINNNQAK